MDRSNEIAAIPLLLQMLELEDCIVTSDREPCGWGCQKAITQQIREQGADYVLTVKENQKHLYDRFEGTFAWDQSQGFPGRPHDDTETVGKDHGRIETRRCWVMGAPDCCQNVNPEQVWTDLQRLDKVKSERRCGPPATTQVQYFIHSVTPDARTLWAAVRNHWRIEKSPHWMLDVAFRVDDRRIRRDRLPTKWPSNRMSPSMA